MSEAVLCLQRVWKLFVNHQQGDTNQQAQITPNKGSEWRTILNWDFMTKSLLRVAKKSLDALNPWQDMTWAFTRSTYCLMLSSYGRAGHVVSMDWRRKKNETTMNRHTWSRMNDRYWDGIRLVEALEPFLGQKAMISNTHIVSLAFHEWRFAASTHIYNRIHRSQSKSNK